MPTMPTRSSPATEMTIWCGRTEEGVGEGVGVEAGVMEVRGRTRGRRGRAKRRGTRRVRDIVCKEERGVGSRIKRDVRKVNDTVGSC